ncbi:hypothetical protein [Pseudomonas subflava]|uniref:hypothetical protein n=1 Tax=Pseudomonas subflava TaxID=2952933 RepID=UPI00207A5C16|nr:hypothetical protein [Pseudomonas subflava]
MITHAPRRIACSDPQLAHSLRRQFDDCEVIEVPLECSRASLCGWLREAPVGERDRVQAALNDAVATLERTRHAFRSRELGQLRQRLERLLVELSAPPE